MTLGTLPGVEFVAHRPPRPLRPYVSVAHGYRVPANPTGIHRGLPSRHLTLVAHISGPLRVSAPSGVVVSHGILGGLHTCAALIDASQPQEGVQYGLTPWAAAALLGVPAGAIGGLVLDLADVLGAEAGRLMERLASTTDWDARFRLVDTVLARRLGEAPPVDVVLAEAWRQILASGGRLPITRLARQVGYSRRHLSERFRAGTGVTPKQAARIARFEAARGMLLQPRPPPLAEVAAACGYADQPHLAREWKALAGCTMTTWLHDERPFVQDVATADPAR